MDKKELWRKLTPEPPIFLFPLAELALYDCAEDMVAGVAERV